MTRLRQAKGLKPLRLIHTPPEITWENPRAALIRHGIRPKRNFSQNFLVDRNIVEKIASVAAAEDTTIIELGPGVGTLTRALLRLAIRVHAIERDPEMVEVLKQDFSHIGALTIEHGDASRTDLSALRNDLGVKALRVAGNIPYAVTGSILRNVITHVDVLEKVTLLVQKEVADRICAAPATKSYGALTVFTAAAFSVKTAHQVPRTAFYPRPAVDSSVICLKPHPVQKPEPSTFSGVVRAAFQARRKTLRNALRTMERGARWTDRAIEDAGLDPERRGETLTLQEFRALAEAAAARKPSSEAP